MIRLSDISLGFARGRIDRLAAAVTLAQRAAACPFCSAVSLTFSEEIANSQVAVIAKLVAAAAEAAGRRRSRTTRSTSPKPSSRSSRFLKARKSWARIATIETVYFGDSPVGTTFLVMGIDPPTINWGTPIAITERGQEYVAKAIELPKEGADRLAFFQDYLEDRDEMLARDAYDEFAKMPYAGVIGLKDRMKHDKLVEWIKSPQIPVSRRRLYLTMLGVCGKPEDLPMLEELIKSKDRQTKGALDALVAAYLTLKGPDGMPLVEELVLEEQGRRIYRHLCHDHGAAISRHRRKNHSPRAAARGHSHDARPPAIGRPGDPGSGALGRLVGDRQAGRAVQERQRRLELGPRAGDQLLAGLPAAGGQGTHRRIGQARSRRPMKRASTLFFPLGAGSPQAQPSTSRRTGTARRGGRCEAGTAMRNPQLQPSRHRESNNETPAVSSKPAEPAGRKETRRAKGRTSKPATADAARRAAPPRLSKDARTDCPRWTAAPVSSRVWPRQPCCWAAHFGLF